MNIIDKVRSFFRAKPICLKGFNCIRTKEHEKRQSPYVTHPITGECRYRYNKAYFKTFTHDGQH